MFKNLLFVCIGNICRSPMAAGYFTHQLKSQREFKISSAGLQALVGEQADANAQMVMQQIGVDISQHRARQLTAAMVSEADLIFAMETFHKQKIEFIFPHARGRVYTLGKWSGFEVPDPYNEDVQAFIETLKLIERGWLDWNQKVMQ